MSAEEKRVAIAEAVGWRLWQEMIDLGSSPLWLHPGHQDMSSLDGHCDALGHSKSPNALPDYLTSLDAIALAEATLSESEYEQFRTALRGLVKANWRAVISASAEARASAFLLAKGLATL